MARKKKPVNNLRPPSAQLPSSLGFNQPFEALSGLKKNLQTQAKSPPSPKPQPVIPPPPPPLADDTLFLMEMVDVAPLAGGDKFRTPPVPPPDPKAWKTPQLPNEDLEVLRNLSDLVSGKTEFDLTFADEYVEGQSRGLPPSLMEQLRAGRIPYQNHLDLHGYTLIQAEAAVTRFILDSVALGRCCVLLIHGRGLGSQDGIPVLKRFLETFLLRGPARKYILAFTTARPVDGGLGASYILLRG